MPALDNPRHEKFAQLVAKGGISDYQAYAQALGANEESALNNSWRLRGDEGISARIAEIQSKAEAKTVLTLARKRTFLLDAVETPVGQLDENSPLVQKMKRTKHADGSETVEVEAVNKLKALELDAKLAGELNGSPTSLRISMFAQGQVIDVETVEDGDKLSLPPGEHRLEG